MTIYYVLLIGEHQKFPINMPGCQYTTIGGLTMSAED